jgi:hypothetical protein
VAQTRSRFLRFFSGFGASVVNYPCNEFIATEAQKPLLAKSQRQVS